MGYGMSSPCQNIVTKERSVKIIHRLNIKKLKNYPWDNVAYFCDEILVDIEHLDSDGDFKPEHLGYIT